MYTYLWHIVGLSDFHNLHRLQGIGSALGSSLEKSADASTR